LREVLPGLFRWATAHPDWRPGAAPGGTSDWPEQVGSVLYEGPDATVLIDPLLPADEAEFLRLLDRRVKMRRLPVSILTTIKFHRRSRDDLARRYDASTSRAKASLPSGVEAHPIRGAGETIFWIPAARALVSGDRILGAAGGGLRVCPQSWLGYLPSGMTVAELKRELRPLLELPVERVLVSHGEPVLRDGGESLRRALA
jgi:hypothetical protein